MCEALKKHPTLKKLYLNHNKITLVQKNKIIPRSKKKQDAYFKERPIFMSFGDLLQSNNVLEELDFSSNKIGFDGLYESAHSLVVNNSLKTLNLINNKICLNGLEVLKNIIELRDNKGFYSLRYLHLQGNLFGNDKSAELIKNDIDDLLSFHMVRYEYGDASVSVESAAVVNSPDEEVNLSDAVDLILEKMNKFEESKSRAFTINPPTNLLPLPSGKSPIMQGDEKSLLLDIMPSILTQHIIIVRNQLQASNFNLDACLSHIENLQGFVSGLEGIDFNGVLNLTIDLVLFENFEVVKKGVELFNVLIKRNVGLYYAEYILDTWKSLDDEKFNMLGLDLEAYVNDVLQGQSFYSGLEPIDDVFEAYRAAQDGTSLFMRILGLESIKALIKKGMITDFIIPCNIAAAAFQVKNKELLSEFNTGEKQIKYNAKAVEIEHDAAADLFRVLLSVYDDAFNLIKVPLEELRLRSDLDTPDYVTYLKLNSYVQKVRAFKDLGLFGIEPIEDLDQVLFAAQDDDDLWTRVLGLKSLSQIIENDDENLIERFVYEISRVLAVSASYSDEIVLREVSFELIKTLFEKDTYSRNDLIKDVEDLVDSLNQKVKDMDKSEDRHLELLVLRFKRLLFKNGVDNQKFLDDFEYDLSSDSCESFISEDFKASDTPSLDTPSLDTLSLDTLSLDTPSSDIAIADFDEISKQYDSVLSVEENYNTGAFLKNCEKLDKSDFLTFTIALKSFHEFLLLDDIGISKLEDLEQILRHIYTAVSHDHLLVRFAGVKLFINLVRLRIIDRNFDSDAKGAIFTRVLEILLDYQNDFSKKLFLGICKYAVIID